MKIRTKIEISGSEGANCLRSDILNLWFRMRGHLTRESPELFWKTRHTYHDFQPLPPQEFWIGLCITRTHTSSSKNRLFLRLHCPIQQGQTLVLVINKHIIPIFHLWGKVLDADRLETCCQQGVWQECNPITENSPYSERVMQDINFSTQRCILYCTFQFMLTIFGFCKLF